VRVCSVSVDLDSLACYYAIHGLGEVPPRLKEVIYRRALPRFAELFGRRKIAATFFVVGSDLAEAGSERRIGQLARAGHEIGNHSHTHPYDLHQRERAFIHEELTRADEAIRRATGQAPVGFRSPGYGMSQALYDAILSRGYRYDSSLFPSWPYYLAKAGVMGLMSAVGRRSRSVLGDPRMLLAPADPYRPGKTPWRPGQAPLVELPIAVSPGLRLHAIGTSLVLLPTRLRAWLLESMRRRPFFNLELHGIDLIGADEDGIPAALVARQPDLRLPLVDKQRAFEATLDRLRPDYRFARLRDVAAEVHRDGHVGG
jgi:peptidoglycan/xylan/chitin deacetylase (PgdA/CDA1 family)